MNLRYLRLNQGGAAGGGAVTPPATPPANDAPPAWFLAYSQQQQQNMNAMAATLAKLTAPATPPAGGSGAAGGQSAGAADDIQQMRATLERQNQRIASQAIENVVSGGLVSAGIPADRVTLAAPALNAAAKWEYDHNTGAVTGLNAQGLRVPAADVVKGWASSTGKFFIPPVQTAGTGINGGGGNAGAGDERTTLAHYSPQELVDMQDKNPDQYRTLLKNSSIQV